MVERYDLDEGGFLGERGRMVPDEFGDYVRVADYAALEDRFVARIEDYEATIARLQEQVETLTRSRDEYRELAHDRTKAWTAAEAERDRLREAGAGLANAAYNLAQNDAIPTRDRVALKQAQEQWDAALQKEPQP